MKGILYVGHGSSYEDARDEAKSFIASVMKMVDVLYQELTFLELAEPAVDVGVKRLVEKGVTHIVVMPVLLLSAGHYYRDIPDEIKEEIRKYPSVTFSYGQALGVKETINCVLQDRINEQTRRLTKGTSILFVGRGSKHPQTKIDIEAIARRLQAEYSDIPVNISYLASLEPKFEDKLQTVMEKRKQGKVIILPYLWFTGYLMRRINRVVSSYRNNHIVVCNQLGGHLLMQQLFVENVLHTIDHGKILEGDHDAVYAVND